MQNMLKVGAATMALAAALPAGAQVTGSRIASSGNFLTLNGNGLSNGTSSIATLTGGSTYTTDMPFADIPKGGVYGSTFLAAGMTAGSLATLTFTNPTSYLSFLWGSPDTYNRFTVNYGGATSGSQTFTATSLGFPDTTGNQSISQYVAFATTAGTFINSVNFFNSPNTDAFETANFAVAPVPEPAAWAMMLLGVGFMGTALRRQRKASVRVAYA